MTVQMRQRIALILLLLLAACEVETFEPKEGSLQLYVPEARFRAIRPGMTAEQVTAQIGAARKKEGAGNADVWVFGVWRGDKPSFLRWLFTSSPIKQATLLEGRIRFVRGLVVNVEVNESSAVPLARPKSGS